MSAAVLNSVAEAAYVYGCCLNIKDVYCRWNMQNSLECTHPVLLRQRLGTVQWDGRPTVQALERAMVGDKRIDCIYIAYSKTCQLNVKRIHWVVLNRSHFRRRTQNRLPNIHQVPSVDSKASSKRERFFWWKRRSLERFGRPFSWIRRFRCPENPLISMLGIVRTPENANADVFAHTNSTALELRCVAAIVFFCSLFVLFL